MGLARRVARRIENFLAGRKTYKWVERTLVEPRDLEGLRDTLDSMRLLRSVDPIFLRAPSGKDILVIAPHPDDESIGPGGTLLAASEAGAQVRVVFLTSGRSGEAADREREARVACEALRAEPIFLRHREGEIDVDRAAQELGDLCRAAPTNTVFLPFLADDHLDHRIANQVLLASISRGDFGDVEIWAYQVYSALIGNVVVDITARMEEKGALIAAHASQFIRRDWTHYARGLAAFNSRLAQNKAQRFLEVFFVVPSREYQSLLERYYRDRPDQE
jgi:N-acetylglucosamine malate deacetylase 1